MSNLSASEFITFLSTTLGGFAALVYWLVRISFKRQGDITDRYFSHLERRDVEQQENIKVFGDSMATIGRNLEEQTAILRMLKERDCKFDGGKKS